MAGNSLKFLKMPANEKDNDNVNNNQASEAGDVLELRYYLDSQGIIWDCVARPFCCLNQLLAMTAFRSHMCPKVN